MSAVNRVLYDDWAPIGFVGGLPQDEYEGYAVRIVAMLVAGAGEAEIVDYLRSLQAGLGVEGTGPQVLARVAVRLVGFRAQALAIAG